MNDCGRTNNFYKIWHASVKKRDGGKCKWPDCKRKGREVHHIIPYSSAPHLRYTVENGILLCKTCHKKVKGKENDFVGMFMAILERYKK